jgi:ubiquinone/menaquinone biosynthesis C-methylase UbiE
LSVDESQRVTRATYDRVAAEFFENTRDRSHGTADLDRFAARLPSAARVLDLGAGPGCDAMELARRGLRPVCADLSLAMLRAAASEHDLPRVQGDLLRLPFPDRSASGVWANACLLHLTPGGLRVALGEIRRVCDADGPVHLSVKMGSGSEWERVRYGLPRFFQYWQPRELDAELTKAGFDMLHGREDETRRDRWIVRLLRTCRGSPAPSDVAAPA